MSKKLLSMLLVLSIIFTMLPVSAVAEEADFTVGAMEELIELASLDEAEKTATTGTSLEDLELTETSTVTVGTNPYTVNGIINGSEEETTVDIPAIWTSEPEFDMDTELPVLTMEEKVDSTVGTKGEIISFEPLDEKEKTVTVGTSLEHLGLPEILTAKVRTNPDTVTGIVYGSEEETTVDVPVTWISEPEYDMDNKGEYVFTPVIEGYIVSAELPMITVTVKAQVKPMMMLSMGEPIEVSTFAALKNAIDNATEDLNLKLTADIIYTGSAALTIPDTKDIDITIDLNDKIFSSSKVSAIEHNGKGTLTIEDNGEEGIGMIKTIDYVTSTINVKNKEAKLRINSGTVENQCTYYTDTRVIHHTAGTIYINGGTINCVNGYGIYSYADYDNNGIINIYDGTIKGANHGIYVLSTVVVNIDGGIIEGTNDTSNAIHLTVYSYGKVTITDGTVHTTGTEAAIHHRGNVTLDILGGTIENTGSGSAIFSNYTGSSSTAVPLTIGGEAELKSNNPDSNSGTIHASTNKVSLMITGGTVVNTSETGNAIFCANPLQANIRSGNSLIKGGNLAIKGLAPIVRVNMKGIASLDYNGEVTEDYQADNINSYKFLQFEPNTADVAQIGEMIYQTLQEAIDHAENKTIKLLKNIALDEAIETKGKSFILDLNGKIIDGEEGTAIMQNGGTLTIQDNVGGGRIITAGSDTITVNNEITKLTIQNVNVENYYVSPPGYTEFSKGNAIYVSNKGTLDIYGCTVTSNKNGIYSWQSYINIYDSTLNAKTSLCSSSDVVNIRNSTINGIKEGILNNTNSTMNISDSTITSDEIAIRTLYGNITITDSTVQSAGNETTIYCVNPKVTLNIIGGTIENTGSGCAIFELDGGVNSVSDISISGGAVISSQNPNANSGTIYVWNVNSSFKLYGATVTNTSSTGNAIFCGDSLQINIRNGNNLIYGGSLAIKGKVPIVRMGMKGMASLEVNGDDKEDYDAENINMYKYLQFVPANVAQIDDVIYTSLQEAVDHADNKIIKLLESTALEAPIDTKGKSFILDLNGNTIDSENGTAIEHNGGTLTIEDNVGGGMITSKGADSTIKLTNDSKLIVTGGTISYAGNGDSTIHHDSTGNLEVNGGTVENTYYSYNLYTRAVIHSTGSGDVIVDGGTVKCNKNDNNMRVIYNDSDGDIIVSEGTVEALGGTAIANYGNGNVIISGGTVKSLSESTIASTIYNRENGNVIVSGGTVEANLGRAIYNYKSGKITISGEAEIKGQSQSYGMIYLNEGTADDTVLEISGGTISNEYNSGTAIYNNASGKISIQGGTCVIWGKGKAMNKLPVLVGELRIMASISHTDGTNVIFFNAETLKTISNYKYLRFEPATAPDAPTDVTATAGDGKATVRFTASAFDGGSEITGYTVKSNPDSITATGTTTEIEVTGLTNGVSYTFTVTATNSIGESMASSESNSVTPKGNQTITFINPGDQNFGTELTLSATASSGLPVTYTSETPEVCTVTSEGEVTFLKAGTATIKVSQEGNAVYLPAEPVTQSFTVNAVKPGTPTDFVVIPGDGQLTLTWTAPADTGGSPITDYEYSINDGTWVSTNSTETRYTVTELTNGTIYTIKVRAVNSKGSGEESISIEAIPVKVTHTITATAGTGGSISPNGSVMVNQGESQTFTITPDSNYSVEDVKVDGISQGKITSYTFSDVSTNHSIAATFSYIGGSSGRSSDNDRDSERDRSSSNSNGIINITPASPDNPGSPTQAEIKVPVTVDADNNATVNITSQNVTEAYDKALAEAKKNGNEENGITLVLNVDTGNKAIDIIKVNLPKAVQDAIIAKKIVNTIIVVDNPDIQITMDLTTVKEINKQANADVNVTSATVDSSNLADEAKIAIGSRPVYDLKVNYGSGRQIENFGDGRVTVTIPYTLGENEKAENICAVYIDDNGKVHWLTDSAYDSVEKVLRFSTNHFSLYGVGYKEEVKTFTDIENHWAKNDIEFVVRQGLFNGTSETSFNPNMAMTRGMFVTVLGRMAKADVSGYKESSFTDVKEDAYYMGYIEWARESGIIKGTGDGKFAPDQSISREQMAVILVNYAKTHGFKLPKVDEEKAFADSDKISAYAKEAVQEMQMSGIINGKDSNLFDPKGMATRAEVSAVLRRFVELISSGVQTY